MLLLGFFLLAGSDHGHQTMLLLSYTQREGIGEHPCKNKDQGSNNIKSN
jgi:hypothetical protein